MLNFLLKKSRFSIKNDNFCSSIIVFELIHYIFRSFFIIALKNAFAGPNCVVKPEMCHEKAKCAVDGKCHCIAGYEGDGVGSCERRFSSKAYSTQWHRNHNDPKTPPPPFLSSKQKKASKFLTFLRHCLTPPPFFQIMRKPLNF